VTEKRNLLRADETLDDLLLDGMYLIQPRNGYRFSLDAILLAHFPNLNGIKEVIDLGTGNGIIPCLLLSRAPALNVIGIENQPEMVDRARRSTIYNDLCQQIEIMEADIREIENILPRGKAELVLSNPPFWRKGEGHLNQNAETATARHEINITLTDLVAKSAYLLQLGGRLAIIQRAQRLMEALAVFQSNKLFPRRLRLIHSRADREANLMLLEGCKNRPGPLHILPPLIVYTGPGHYCQEIIDYYRSAE